MNKLFKQAFTLIELLVVIAIIGILSGLIVVSMGGMTTKAAMAKAQIFSNSLRNSLLSNIIGEWKMDEGTGQTAADSWGGVNNGTLGSTTGTDTNDPAWTTSGCVYGNCLSFDGSDDYVDIGNMDSVNGVSQLTISGWVKRNSGYGAIFYKNPSTTNPSQWIEVAYHNSGLLYFETSEAFINANIAIPTGNEWKLITCVFDGTQTGNSNRAKIYVNGVLQSSTFVGIIPSVTASPSGTAKIGRDMWNSATLNGYIDDVRVYNAAMPTSQIKEQYFAGLNSLLASGSINTKEYGERINSVAKQ